VYEKWAPIYKEKNIDMSIVITGDHSTPVFSGDHGYGPVPFAISSIGLMVNEMEEGGKGKGSDVGDEVEVYDEVACGQGVLGRFSACEAIEFMKNFNKYVRGKLDC